MIELLFSLSLFLTGGNIIDTKLHLHKYDKDNYKDIFLLNNKEAITTYCVRHSVLEDIRKIKYYHNGERKTKYKVSKNNKE